MRFFLSIDLNNSEHKDYTFKETLISKFLTVEHIQKPASNINLTTLQYDRKYPGLVEQNWENPIYNDDNFFLFIGGFVLFRNAYRTEDKIVPTPDEILKILNESGDNHYSILKGNYYIILYDKKSSKISLYSSPMFMHPGFYSFINNHLIFTNYLESFKEYMPISLDNQGMVEFALFDHCLHTRTIYKDIYSVQGGYHTEFSMKGIDEKLVYDVVNWNSKKPLKRKEAIGGINKALKTSIGDYVQNTDYFNISLTGGFDGRLNFSFIEKKDYSKLKARSYGMKGSSQISVPLEISKVLSFDYDPVFFDKEFEVDFSKEGFDSILLTCGITGFNRANYPYAYNKYSEFSRSCILGQCDMIRPMFNNPAGVIFNDFSWPVFFNDYETFRMNVMRFSKRSFLNEAYFTNEIIDTIYKEIHKKYIANYNELSKELQFYFFLLKESLMKYWHTEFHLVDIFVDDYVSFSDLDYLELLFNSEYAGIYKGLLAKSQFSRKSPHDLYVDLMSINNDKLNYIYNDRYFKPGWLKFGKLGWVMAAIAKKIGKHKNKTTYNDTFDMLKWSKSFYSENNDAIQKHTLVFNSIMIDKYLNNENDDSGMSYRFNRSISLKLWLQRMNLI